MQNNKNKVQLKKVLALITARGGSKRLPRKNILQVNGRPLIEWTIAAALKSNCITEVVLSSDDDEIIKVAENAGCSVPFRRPHQLATDSASSIDVVLHALDILPEYDFVVLLQPTSPLRTSKDIDSAFALLESKNAPSCISVCEVDQSPYWMYQTNKDGRLEKLLPSKTNSPDRKQDLAPVYYLNGAIYIAKVNWLRKTRSFTNDGCIAYPMPKERSIDIDNENDFKKFCATIQNI